jgi:hypothetical protein
VCLGGIWTEGGLILTLVQGKGEGSEVLLEQVHLNLSFRNKFIIVLVDNNTILYMCVFKMSYRLH